MAKGVSIKFKSYAESVPKILENTKLDSEIKTHDKIVLKASLKISTSVNTPVEFTEAVLSFCLANKNPSAQVFIAEGSDGEDTMQLFEKAGYKNLAEKYSIGLIDLNNTEAEEVFKPNFNKFDSIMYPKILKEGFIISLPKLAEDPELEMQASLSNMIGAFPARYYKGLFSKEKSKIRRWPLKFSLHDLLLCKMPEFALIDTSDYDVILAGIPLEMDKQAAKLLGKEWKSVSHLRLISESIPESPSVKEKQTENKEVQY